MNIFTINNKKEEKFLRQRVPLFDFSKVSKKEINETVKILKNIMKEANGIGLSANQIGLNQRFFVARVPNQEGQMKFYTIFNPEIIKFSSEKETLAEGCLSVPGLLGSVKRPQKIIVTGFDKNGKKIKIQAWGLLARVFQHEIDHLNGILFIDKAEKVFKEEQEESTKI
jgi:peptide deformylase